MKVTLYKDRTEQDKPHKSKGRHYIIYKWQEVQKKIGKEVEVGEFSKEGNNKIKLTYEMNQH